MECGAFDSSMVSFLQFVAWWCLCIGESVDNCSGEGSCCRDGLAGPRRAPEAGPFVSREPSPDPVRGHDATRQQAMAGARHTQWVVTFIVCSVFDPLPKWWRFRLPPRRWGTKMLTLSIAHPILCCSASARSSEQRVPLVRPAVVRELVRWPASRCRSTANSARPLALPTPLREPGQFGSTGPLSFQCPSLVRSFVRSLSFVRSFVLSLSLSLSLSRSLARSLSLSLSLSKNARGQLCRYVLSADLPLSHARPSCLSKVSLCKASVKARGQSPARARETVTAKIHGKNHRFSGAEMQRLFANAR